MKIMFIYDDAIMCDERAVARHVVYNVYILEA